MTEAASWMETFRDGIRRNQTVANLLSSNALAFVICPAYILIPTVISYLGGLKNVYVGIQDISQFKSGSYTGEVTADLLPPEIHFAIIGHPERRKYFHETDEIIAAKARLLAPRSISSITCIQNATDAVPNESSFVAYEPESAVGQDYDESLSTILDVKKTASLKKEQLFLYGGNVNTKNIDSYLASTEINGFLVGRASLDANEFLQLASHLKV